MNTKTFLPGLLCLALLNTVSFAQDDAKPAPKKDAPAEKKEGTKEKKKAPVTPRDEATALKEFKGDMKKIKEWVKSKKETETNPAAGMRMITEITGKMADVRTDGLPEDLSKPFGEMNELLTKMSSFFEGAPAEDDEFQAWLAKKVSDAEFLQQMQEEMPKLGAAMEKKGKELKEAGAKYGLEEELDFDDKDKKGAKKGDDDGDEKEDDKDGDEKKEKGKKEDKEEK